MLLIDEVDRLDIESEALLLEVLSDYQVSIPEFGTVTARHIPQVFLTSNNSRDLSEALKRRCLFLHLGYPSVEREAEIVRLHVPGLAEHLATEIAELIAVLRQADLKKPPSIAESLDWARTLLTLGATDLSDDLIRQTLSVLLKYERDIDTALTGLAPSAGKSEAQVPRHAGDAGHAGGRAAERRDSASPSASTWMPPPLSRISLFRRRPSPAPPPRTSCAPRC